MVLPGTLFEELGFNYIGRWTATMSNARDHPENLRQLHRPQFLHVVTRKARVYARRKPPDQWHGRGPFEPRSGTIFKEKATGRPTRRSSGNGV